MVKAVAAVAAPLGATSGVVWSARPRRDLEARRDSVAALASLAAAASARLSRPVAAPHRPLVRTGDATGRTSARLVGAAEQVGGPRPRVPAVEGTANAVVPALVNGQTHSFFATFYESFCAIFAPRAFSQTPTPNGCQCRDLTIARGRS